MFGAGLAVTLAGTLFWPAGFQNASASGETRTLSMFNIHTKEAITVTFKKDGRYDPDALKQLNHFMRDWRKDQQRDMDPELDRPDLDPAPATRIAGAGQAHLRLPHREHQ